MPNDPVLIDRVRELAAPDLVEKTVFGARCWISGGNMAFGVHDDDLLVRLGPEPGPAAERDSVRPFDPIGKGKPMAGWFLVSQDELAEDEDLLRWLDRAMAFVETLVEK